MRFRPAVATLAVTLPLSFAGVSDCQTVYDNTVLDVSDADVVATMSTVVDCVQHEHVGGGAATVSGECHTQGISRYFDTTVVSCQDGDAGECGEGVLDTFFLPLEEYSDPNPWANPMTVTPDELVGDLDHVAAGQALEPLSGSFSDVLVPVVSSSDDDIVARVDLYDGWGGEVCHFTHTPAYGSDDHLGAAALYSVGGTVYMAACSWDCDWMYIYQLDPTDSDCGPVQLSATDMCDDSNRSPIQGSKDETWSGYNSLAVFQREGQGSDDVYLAAGHHGWLDTWEIDDANGRDPHFTKKAKAHWGTNQANHGSKEMLYEGMTIQQVDADSFDLWMAPHDFGDCDGGRECMRAVYQCRMDF